MKKVFSILLTCALLLSLVSVVSLADTGAQRSVPLLGVVVDGATETQELPADGMGGVSIPGTGGWKAWVSYWTDEVADFAPEAGEKLYLVYDMTVAAGTNVQFTINGWNNPISKELAGAAAELGEGGVYSIPGGTYSGTLELDRAQIGDNGRIGVLGNGIDIRTCALVCTSGTPMTPDPAPSAKPSEKANIKGDANTDELVNMKDVLLLRKYLAGIDASPDMAASDVNNDGAVNMKDVLMIRKYIADIIKSFDDVDPSDPSETDPSATNPSETAPSSTEPQGKPVTGELDLIEVITNGSDETDGTAIKDEGNGFVIEQTKDWNVWVLYFNENAPFFCAGEGENVFLEYDMTLNGDAHLNVNAWNNSIAAAIASASGAATTFAEDGTPMLVQGTYKGKAQIDPTLFGETGRLGIVGKGAVIRTFRFVSEKGGTDTTASTKATSGPTETVPSKTTPPTQSETPYLNYETSEKFGSLGVWWWNANQISNETQRKQRLDFLQQNGVTEIYLCVTSQSFDDVADFIVDAGSRGMRVAWLSGDVSWIQNGNTGFDGMFARFKTYQNQAPANAKFYGIHLDVEPHQAGSSQANWQLYADLVMRATKDAHDFGTLIEWDIPFWLDDMTVTVGGKTQKLLNVLAENSDTLTLMSYRDTAAAILDASAQEIPLGSQYNCKIILGVETYSEEGAYVSFMEDGKAAMYSALQTVLSTLSGKDTLSAGYGCAVHYVDTWMNLKN